LLSLFYLLKISPDNVISSRNTLLVMRTRGRQENYFIFYPNIWIADGLAPRLASLCEAGLGLRRMFFGLDAMLSLLRPIARRRRDSAIRARLGRLDRLVQTTSIVEGAKIENQEAGSHVSPTH
jgi:hypothetical protein